MSTDQFFLAVAMVAGSFGLAVAGIASVLFMLALYTKRRNDRLATLCCWILLAVAAILLLFHLYRVL